MTKRPFRGFGPEPQRPAAVLELKDDSAEAMQQVLDKYRSQGLDRLTSMNMVAASLMFRRARQQGFVVDIDFGFCPQRGVWTNEAVATWLKGHIPEKEWARYEAEGLIEQGPLDQA